MSTHCILLLTGSEYESDPPSEIAVVYRQSDGYPEGMGENLLEILKGREVVNGYNDKTIQINGPNCMAAMVVAGLKEGCGNIYLYPPGSRNLGEYYIYTLTAVSNKPIKLKVEIPEEYGGETLYDGDLDSFDPKQCEREEEAQ